MNDSRKISYQSLKEKLSDEKLKLIIAGSTYGPTSCSSGQYLCVVDCSHVRPPLAPGTHQGCFDSNDHEAALKKFCWTEQGSGGEVVCTWQP